MKQRKGITLVSIVVTILVLTILLGVTVKISIDNLDDIRLKKEQEAQRIVLQRADLVWKALSKGHKESTRERTAEEIAKKAQGVSIENANEIYFPSWHEDILKIDVDTFRQRIDDTHEVLYEILFDNAPGEKTEYIGESYAANLYTMQELDKLYFTLYPNLEKNANPPDSLKNILSEEDYNNILVDIYQGFVFNKKGIQTKDGKFYSIQQGEIKVFL